MVGLRFLIQTVPVHSGTGIPQLMEGLRILWLGWRLMELQLLARLLHVDLAKRCPVPH